MSPESKVKSIMGGPIQKVKDANGALTKAQQDLAAITGSEQETAKEAAKAVKKAQQEMQDISRTLSPYG